MNNTITTLPQSVPELRAIIKQSIEMYSESPVKNENKLNEVLAKSLGFSNYDQLSSEIKIQNNVSDTSTCMNGQVGQSFSNPVIAVVRENKDEGGFIMSFSNIPYCDVILIEEDICGDGNGVDFEGVTMLGWGTSCDYDEKRAEKISTIF
jgi:hypothetical protein